MATYAAEETVLDLLAGTTDSDLTAHTPDSGGAWSTGFSGLSPKLDGEGGAYNPGANPAKQIRVINGAAFASADQIAQCQVKNHSDLGTATKMGVAVRSSAAVGTCTGYALYYNAGGSDWKLSKILANVETVLESYAEAGDAIPVGEIGSCVLVVEADQLRAVVQGIQRTPVTDAAIGAAGAPGVVCHSVAVQAANTGAHVRQLLFASIP